MFFTDLQNVSHFTPMQCGGKGLALGSFYRTKSVFSYCGQFLKKTRFYLEKITFGETELQKNAYFLTQNRDFFKNCPQYEKTLLVR